jgi:coenzyme F420-reducing hydrogenase alpha subunit
MSREREIKVGYLSRVEGQGSLEIKVSSGNIKELRLEIFEPPKFFEAFLVGRHCSEVHELTSRICGICPVPHQITALRAIENAMGIQISEQTRKLRRIMNYGCHIASHILSLYFLAAPDYLGCESVFAMVKDYFPIVKRALQLKKLGNDLVELIGGRTIHPVSAVVNGFTKIPEREDMRQMRQRLVDAKQDAADTTKFIASLNVPQFVRKCEHVALSNPEEFAVNEGLLASTEGIMVEEEKYREYVRELQVDYSWAKHSEIVGRGAFLVGPLARVNLNFDKLSHDSKKLAQEIGFEVPNFNPFMSHVARALEVVNAIDDCVKTIDEVPLKEEDRSYEIGAGTGYAITEAPRGLLYHSYEVGEDGAVKKADIVTPTAHNARNMENDLRELVPTIADLPDEEATLKCEMLIRAYDPCISCSVHYVNLDKPRKRKS